MKLNEERMAFVSRKSLSIRTSIDTGQKLKSRLIEIWKYFSDIIVNKLKQIIKLALLKRGMFVSMEKTANVYEPKLPDHASCTLMTSTNSRFW